MVRRGVVSNPTCSSAKTVLGCVEQESNLDESSYFHRMYKLQPWLFRSRKLLLTVFRICLTLCCSRRMVAAGQPCDW